MGETCCRALGGGSATTSVCYFCFLKKETCSQKASISVLDRLVGPCDFLLPAPVFLHTPDFVFAMFFSAQMLSNNSLHFYVPKAHITANQRFLILGNSVTILNWCNSTHFLQKSELLIIPKAPSWGKSVIFKTSLILIVIMVAGIYEVFITHQVLC